MDKRNPTLPLKSLYLATLLLGLLLGCSKNDPSISGKMPELSLMNLMGETKSLNKIDSKLQLLVFWATWCQPCLMEIPQLVNLHEKYKDQGFEVVSINVDDPEGGIVGQIYSVYNINYEVFLGSDATMAKFGNVQALPTSFFIDKTGKILDKIEGLRQESYLEAKIQNYLKK